ncbi:MAG: hypothetical protein KC680_03850 [Candidatus Peregrinibacteria bacterium]|nr:hypothetical protein [Candidatus Peregrinibacteria bacterium]
MTIIYQSKNEPEWVIPEWAVHGSKPPAEELWNILSAYKARRHAEQAEETGLWSLAATLRAYADKVDELQGKG